MPAPHPPSSTVLLTGATGFVGLTLARQLLQDGSRLIVLSRDTARARSMFGSGSTAVDRLDTLPDDTRIDAVVHLAGARVLGMPWTDSRRAVLMQSRLRITTAIVALLQRLQQRPGVLVGASAVGYYGDQGEPSHPPRTESAPPRPGQFASDLCVAIEAAAQQAEALGVRVVRPRFGVVMGQGDGAFPMLALSARLGLGAVLGTGRQLAPWVHLEDAVGIIRFAMAHPSLTGPVNAVAPEVPSQADFTRALAAAYGRGVHLRMPAGPLRLLGGEMAGLLLAGENVVPQAALEAGYTFRFPTVAAALADLTAKDRA